MSQWEYLVVVIAFEWMQSEFNVYGAKGWELVTLESDSEDEVVNCIFKRPKPEGLP